MVIRRYCTGLDLLLSFACCLLAAAGERGARFWREQLITRGKDIMAGEKKIWREKSTIIWREAKNLPSCDCDRIQIQNPTHRQSNNLQQSRP
jgi:hypothetical protein